MEHLSLKKIAYNMIRQKLLNHEFEPGSRIREDLLALEFSMSRTPVREAINQLSAQGFLVNIPRKGVFFVEYTKQDILDLLLVREGLEILAVQRCIEKINQEQIEELENILKDYETALLEENFQEYSRLDSLFHKTIAGITENKKLIEFISEIEDFMRVTRAMQPPDSGEQKRERAIGQHRNILTCIKKRNKEGAVSAIRTNINGMKEKLGIER
jgi:DNA-binding GntR family transcriptional regulator